MQAQLLQAMWNNAAQFGLLDVIVDLHIHGFPGCTTSTMDIAAICGNVNIVHFLFHHKKQYCSTKAMNGACAYGHIKVVKFLYTHLLTHCNIDEAIRIAKLNGRTKIVSFLENETK